MKRILCVICIIGFLLTGCSVFNRPSNLSINCYTIALNILSVTDDYLDKEISAVVAAGQIQDLCRTLSAVPDEAGTHDQEVKSYCEMLSYTVMLVADGDHINKKEIVNTRNILASLLGENARE